MKKSLIALAVLAASGASFAQSSVTVYGLADVWVGSVKTETAGVSTSTTQMTSGGVSGSRWGLKGSEDLGGGLKANFLLEQGFALDSGSATAGQAFSRQSYVGFSGGFGEVKLGKVWSAYDDVSGASDAMFDSGALAPMNVIFKSTGYIGNGGNTIYYASPEMGGFAGAFSYGLDENVPGTATITSLNVTYGAGPVAAQFGYQVEDLAATSNDTKFMRLGGSYDFGMAVAKLTYGKVTNVGNASGADATEYQLGVDVPVGTALTLSASYAKSDDNATLGNQSRSGVGLAAAYTLSKRTFLYTGYTNNKFSQPTASDDTVSAFAVGVQHKF
jgi:predicted porin